MIKFEADELNTLRDTTRAKIQCIIDLDKVLSKGSAHYKKFGGLEPLEVIVSNQLGFLEGSVLKYLLRFRASGNARKDLGKARHCIEALEASIGVIDEPETANVPDNTNYGTETVPPIPMISITPGEHVTGDMGKYDE